MMFSLPENQPLCLKHTSVWLKY